MRNIVFATAALAAGVTMAASGDAYAQAGLLSHRKDLAPITLASGKPLAQAPYELEAGKYYRIAIESDGSAELAVADVNALLTVEEKKAGHFGRARLELRTKGKCTTPRHEFFDAAQDLLDALAALRQSLGLHRLRLLRDLLLEGTQALRDAKRQRRVIAFGSNVPLP